MTATLGKIRGKAFLKPDAEPWESEHCETCRWFMNRKCYGVMVSRAAFEGDRACSRWESILRGRAPGLSEMGV